MDLKTLTTEAGLVVSDQQCALMEQYADLLLVKNESVNLTAIRGRDEALIKHLVDALMVTLVRPFRAHEEVLDLGTGGGIPGIPLAILFPQTKFTLVDSVHKKIDAVAEFAAALRLSNVKALCARAEELGHDPQHREFYDVVLSRAVAPLRILAELALPLVRQGGSFIAYKGPDYLTELTEAAHAITELQCEKPQTRTYSLPQGAGQRMFIIIEKKQPTPSRYPRRTGMPEKRPL